MKYEHEIILKDGRSCQLRSAVPEDAATVLDLFLRCHEETDWLLTYPDENTFTIEDERDYLERKTDSSEIEIIAFVDGKPVGTAGVNRFGEKAKIRHRAEFGISILREYWGLGIGRALTEACVAFAREAGYAQLELEAVAENDAAVSLYKSAGFIEYGRNPLGFRSRQTGWQELVLMRLPFDQK